MTREGPQKGSETQADSARPEGAAREDLRADGQTRPGDDTRPDDKTGPDIAARIESETRRSLRVLWAERIVGAVWPAYAVLAGFLGFALAGGFEVLPRWAHLTLLPLFLVGFVLAVWRGVVGFHRPDRAQARAALEAKRPDRPLAALDDRIAVGREDAGAQALWAAHQRRMAEQAGLLRARAARLRLSHRDPLAFRLTALILLLFGLLAAAGAGRDRVVAAFDPGAATAGAAEISPTVEAWASPPAYTGAPMIYLTERLGETIKLPQGSQISLRVYNAAQKPRLTQDVAEAAGAEGTSTPDPAASNPDASDPDAPVAAEIDLTPFGEGAWDLRLTAEKSGVLSVDPAGAAAASWRFEIAPDAAPSIAFDDGSEATGGTGQAIGQTETGALRVTFRTEDDHGVATAWAVIELDRDRLAQGSGFGESAGALLPPPPGLAEPIELELPLPLTGAAREVRKAMVEDLTAHPWAGLPVVVTLHAEDARGQAAQSESRQAILPARSFYDPMARALVEERRALAWTLSNARPVSQRLKAATAYPDDWFESLAGPYLTIRAAIRRLDYARADGRLAAEAGSVLEMLWQAALMLEEGDLNSAAERLRRAKDRLSDALERGESEQEIARLMDELRQAMNDYLSEMMRQAMQNLDQMNQQGQPGEQGQELTGQDLQEMLDEIERMAREGDPETAQQMLERLAQMLQNLQMQARQGGQGQSQQGQGEMDQLGDMLRQQQDLADRSFEEMRRRQGQGQGQGSQQPGEGQDGEAGGQPGQGGRPGEGQPGQGGQSMDGAAQEQEALRQLLDQLRQGLPKGLSPEAEQALRDADEAMKGARESLQGDDPDGALDDQVQAMENLREGSRQLGEALRQQANEGQGDRAGRASPDGQDEGRDPLGRPTSNRGVMEGSDTHVPGEEALKRARELLDEIRRRSGDMTRPDVELDYLRRLLDRF